MCIFRLQKSQLIGWQVWSLVNCPVKTLFKQMFNLAEFLIELMINTSQILNSFLIGCLPIIAWEEWHELWYFKDLQRIVHYF